MMKLAIRAVLITSTPAFMAEAPQRVSTKAPVTADIVAEAPEEPKYPQINGEFYPSCLGRGGPLVHEMGRPEPRLEELPRASAVFAYCGSVS